MIVAVVEIMNTQTSKEKTHMRLVRRLVLSELFFNILFRAKLYREKLNVAADHLSRFLKFQEAKMLAPWLKLQPTLLPLKIVYIK